MGNTCRIIKINECLRQRIPTKDNLRRKGVSLDDGDMNCVLCGEQNEENLSHLFFECKAKSNIWSEVHRWFNVSTVMHNNPTLNFLHNNVIFDSKKEMWFVNIVWFGVVWTIWKMHNETIFDNVSPIPNDICKEIKERVWSWMSRSRNS